MAPDIFFLLHKCLTKNTASLPRHTVTLCILNQ